MQKYNLTGKYYNGNEFGEYNLNLGELMGTLQDLALVEGDSNVDDDQKVDTETLRIDTYDEDSKDEKR